MRDADIDRPIGGAATTGQHVADRGKSTHKRGENDEADEDAVLESPRKRPARGSAEDSAGKKRTRGQTRRSEAAQEREHLGLEQPLEGRESEETMPSNVELSYDVGAIGEEDPATRPRAGPPPSADDVATAHAGEHLGLEQPIEGREADETVPAPLDDYAEEEEEEGSEAGRAPAAPEQKPRRLRHEEPDGRPGDGQHGRRHEERGQGPEEHRPAPETSSARRPPTSPSTWGCSSRWRGSRRTRRRSPTSSAPMTSPRRCGSDSGGGLCGTHRGGVRPPCALVHAAS
eukprot:tig00000202_g16619.t1